MRLTKLSDVNDIYNFQDTIILCEIFENRATEMMSKFPYNPRKCTSASSLSGCIHRYLYKSIISVPTQAETVALLKKNLIDGFTCVNTRLALDSIILLLKDNQNQFKEKSLKVIYKINNELKNIFEDKGGVTKILKMDENNQYCNAMTKLLLTDRIKRAKKIPTMKDWTSFCHRH